jgi:hypothetical protein
MHYCREAFSANIHTWLSADEKKGFLSYNTYSTTFSNALVKPLLSLDAMPHFLYVGSNIGPREKRFASFDLCRTVYLLYYLAGIAFV